MSRNICLQDKKILITGSGRGLGLNFAESLLLAGAKVVVSDNNKDLLIKAKEKLKNNFKNFETVELDVSNEDSVKAGVNFAAQKLGGLDGLVNNAAITNSGGIDLSNLEVEKFNQVLQVNVLGVWLMVKYCRDFLKQSQNGVIVNIASDTALWGAENLLAYVASKGAVISMTRSMARELGKENITVNVIAPGLVLSESTEYVPKERHELYLNNRALKREQNPEDVCGTVNFLMSKQARFITGQVLPVNGGFIMN